MRKSAIILLSFCLLGCSGSLSNVMSDNNDNEMPKDVKDQIKVERDDRRNTYLKTLPPKYKNEYSSKYPLEK